MKSVLLIGFFSVALVAPASAAPRASSDTPVAVTEVMPAVANAAPRTEAVTDHALHELRRTFTLGGKPVPPLIFRDLGDGNLADTKSMLVTVDVEAAMHSNQYGAEIKREHGFVTQLADSTSSSTDEERPDAEKPHEEEAYRYLGATPDGLLVVVTRNTPEDGNGSFMFMHVLEAARSAALDKDGKRYERITLTTLQTRSLDGWIGKSSFEGNVLTLTGVDTGRGSRAEPITETQHFPIVRP